MKTSRTVPVREGVTSPKRCAVGARHFVIRTVDNWAGSRADRSETDPADRLRTPGNRLARASRATRRRRNPPDVTGFQSERHTSVMNLRSVQPRLAQPPLALDESAGQARMADKPRASPVGQAETGEADRDGHEAAVQAAFAMGSRIATHSTWWVIGKRSKTRRVRTR